MNLASVIYPPSDPTGRSRNIHSPFLSKNIQELRVIPGVAAIEIYLSTLLEEAR
jgi:hypothetical protein